MDKIDVKPTADSIRRLANYLRDTADRIDRIEKKMIETNDISYAGEVIGEITGILLNGRIDLLITRPIRAYDDLIDRMEVNNVKT